jgi:hypothetical protein
MTKKTTSTNPPAGLRQLGVVALLALTACGPLDPPAPAQARVLHQFSPPLRGAARLLWARNHYILVKSTSARFGAILGARFQIDEPALDTLDPQTEHSIKHSAAWHARTVGIAGDMILVFYDMANAKSFAGFKPDSEARLLRVNGKDVVSEHKIELPGGFNPAANGFVPTGISQLADSSNTGHYYVFWKSELFATAMITIQDLNGVIKSWSWQDTQLGLDGMELRGIIQHDAEEYRALFAAGGEAQVARLACTHHVSGAGNLCVSWRKTGILSGFRRDGWHARAITTDWMQRSHNAGPGPFTRLLWANDTTYTAELWTLNNDLGNRCVYSIEWPGCPAADEVSTAADKTYSHATEKLRAFGVFIQPL